MSDSYNFLPWVRRGLAGAIQAKPSIESGRVQIDVQATLLDKSSGATANAPTTVTLFGPGDVTGFDPRLVIRTDPVHLANDFEPNYFPVVEFDLPDFPWLFTPAARDAQERLQPWICLVAVEKTEGKLTVDASKPLPVLHIQHAQAELPNLDEAWAWVHAQVSGVLENGETYEDVLEKKPERTLSRLICPRRLKGKTSYLACIVPTFKGGCQAGLGDKVDDSTALDLAWDANTKVIDLPVYYHWEFTTSEVDDFESLVWQLQRCNDLPRGVGMGSMRVRPADPVDPSPPWPTGADLPIAELPVEGALRPYRSEQSDRLAAIQAKTEYEQFQETLRSLLNGATPAASLPPGLPISPPIYGRWHAAQGAIPASPPPAARDVAWLRELNLNPTHRVAAALGTRIVQNQQAHLMASAWDQLGEIERANQALRQAQMARAASAAIHKGWLQALPPEVFLAATAPVQTRVVADPSDVLDPAGTPGRKTVAAVVESSRTSATLLQGPFRRLASPRGPLARRAAIQGGKLLSHEMIRRVNAGELSVASQPKAPGGMMTMDAVFAEMGRSERFCTVTPAALYEVILQRTPPPGALSTGLESQVLVQLDALLATPALPAEVQRLLHSARDRLRSIQLRTANRNQWRAVDEIEGVLTDMIAADEALFAAARFLTDLGNLNEADAVRSVRGNLEQIVTRQDRYMLLLAIKAATQQVGMVSCDPPQPRTPPALKLERIKDLLLEALDPRTTITARLKARLEAPGWGLDELEPIMAAPDFPQPLYKALADLSQDFLLPGLEHVPPNTVAGLVTNPRFIEAFMVGLNHEMSRELLWRGFPTDQRGTYFRQFWETRGRVPKPEGDAAKDVGPIHAWKADNRLGKNLNQQAAAEGMITLLIRGELLRRYPRAMIYLAKGAWSIKDGVFVKDSQGRYLRQPSTTEEYPIFSGELPPDITFLGFAKTPDAVAAEDVFDTQTSDPSAEPAGWFIVIQQPPTEPRFGLDEIRPETPTGTWNDLAWPDIETTHETTEEGDQDGYVRIIPEDPAKSPKPPNNEPAEIEWGASSAAMAYITMQLPFRAAIHASDLL